MSMYKIEKEVIILRETNLRKLKGSGSVKNVPEHVKVKLLAQNEAYVKVLQLIQNYKINTTI